MLLLRPQKFISSHSSFPILVRISRDHNSVFSGRRWCQSHCLDNSCVRKAPAPRNLNFAGRGYVSQNIADFLSIYVCIHTYYGRLCFLLGLCFAILKRLRISYLDLLNNRSSYDFCQE